MPGSLRALRRSMERAKFGYNRKHGGPKNNPGQARRKSTKTRSRQHLVARMRAAGMVFWSEFTAKIRAAKIVRRAERKRARERRAAAARRAA